MFFYFYFGLKKGEFTINEFLFWSFFSILIIFFGIKPSFLKFITDFFQFYRILDFVTVVGFMFFTIAILYLYKHNKRLEKKLNSLVVKLAVENKKDRRSKK